MTIDSKLLMSILAMDTYNHGYESNTAFFGSNDIVSGVIGNVIIQTVPADDPGITVPGITRNYGQELRSGITVPVY